MNLTKPTGTLWVTDRQTGNFIEAKTSALGKRRQEWRGLRATSAMPILPLLLLLILPLVAQAQFEYAVDNGTITITKYTGPGGDVVIPETINGLPVTSIGSQAFSSCTDLTSITIPDSVTSIGDHAFSGCSGLTTVTIPDSVTSVEGGTFHLCTGLTSVVIGNSVTQIGNWAFQGCTRLTSVVIPDSVTNIGGWAFNDCTSLTSIRMSDSVTSIGEYAFSSCTGLTSITIPDSVTSVEDAAFLGCVGLTSVTIPNSVISIGNYAFYGCTGLTAITVDVLNPAYSSLDGVLFNKDQTTLIRYPVRRAGGYAVPDSVTSIGAGAFHGCTYLTSITIPDSVTSIGNSAFSGCTGLVSITIPDSVTRIGHSAFSLCLGLQAVYFNGDAPAMGDGDFSQTMATLFYLPGTAGWSTTTAGRPTVLWNGLFGAQSLEMYAGLTMIGEIGRIYSVEYATELVDPTESDWRCLEYLQLPASPYLWADKTAQATGKRFYRAVAMEPPENMVFIPPGTFRMGSPTNEVDRAENEGPQTDVIITRGFWMGKFEVTQGEYLEVMGNNPSWFNGVRDWPESGTDYGTDLTRPVESVSWDGAVAYCAALTERERAAGRIAPNAVYRLPTEAEWEYACRAWTSTRFSYGDDPMYTELTNHAWYSENNDDRTQSVGQKQPNLWGLHDMHGNVWEWCQDAPGPYYGWMIIDPQGLPGYDTYYMRVIRGGGWRYPRVFEAGDRCRSACRNWDYRSGPDYHIGFRAVLAPGQP